MRYKMTVKRNQHNNYGLRAPPNLHIGKSMGEKYRRRENKEKKAGKDVNRRKGI